MSETLLAVLLGGILAFIPQLIILGVQNSRQKKERQIEYLQTKKTLYLSELREVEIMLADKDLGKYSGIFSKELLLATPSSVYIKELEAYIEGSRKLGRKEITESQFQGLEADLIEKIGLHILNLDQDIRRLLDL